MESGSRKKLFPQETDGNSKKSRYLWLVIEWWRQLITTSNIEEWQEEKTTISKRQESEKFVEKKCSIAQQSSRYTEILTREFM